MTDPIDKIRTSCNELIVALEQDSCPDLIVIAMNFSNAVDQAMDAYKRGEISVDMSVMPKIMHSFATEELPDLCRGNKEDREKARKQCRLFLITMEELVQPKSN
ncbi:MAG: hypothetical protein GF411_01695 [Candidatus Lokiarchaeota archaeon]|nr:hypothetical protein [Candidatus Lokiarchaeota archaeon]